MSIKKSFAATALMLSSVAAFSATADSAAVSVSATLVPVCTVATTATTLAVTYTSGGAAQSNSTPITVTCTKGAGYTLGLDAASGSVMGLNYTVAIDGTVPTSGTGAAQTGFSLKASFAAGQAGEISGGTVTATSATTHKLTVTY